MNAKNHDGVPAFVPRTTIGIRHISSAQLERFGIDEIAFVKPLMTENGKAFAIHAADGTPMAIASKSKVTPWLAQHHSFRRSLEFSKPQVIE